MATRLSNGTIVNAGGQAQTIEWCGDDANVTGAHSIELEQGGSRLTLQAEEDLALQTTGNDLTARATGRGGRIKIGKCGDRGKAEAASDIIVDEAGARFTATSEHGTIRVGLCGEGANLFLYADTPSRPEQASAIVVAEAGDHLRINWREAGDNPSLLPALKVVIMNAGDACRIHAVDLTVTENIGRNSLLRIDGMMNTGIGCNIGEGSEIKAAQFMTGTSSAIGANSTITAEQASFAADTTLSSGTIIRADRVILREGTVLEPGVRIIADSIKIEGNISLQNGAILDCANITWPQFTIAEQTTNNIAAALNQSRQDPTIRDGLRLIHNARFHYESHPGDAAAVDVTVSNTTAEIASVLKAVAGWHPGTLEVSPGETDEQVIATARRLDIIPERMPPGDRPNFTLHFTDPIAEAVVAIHQNGNFSR